MANTYSTGNPIGSADPRDAVDNRSNFDEFALSSGRTYTDRLGADRKTITGALQDYAAYNPRGDWAAATAYNTNDIWKDPATGDFYFVPADYTSGASVAADIAAGNVVPHQIKNTVFAIDTIADLRALEPLFDGQQVELLGHTITGVGGGVFYADFSSSAADDNGVTIVTAGGKRWKRKISECVMLEMFGAVSGAPANAELTAALSTGFPLLITQIFPLNDAVNIPDGSVIIGLSRDTTGFIADTGFSIPGAASSMLVVDASSSGVSLSNFKVDANNVGDGVSKRLNCVSLSGGSTNSHISAVDVYNCTGYGHVTFGRESDPDVTAYYEDCYADNCQVLFEQIGALDVTLVHCRARGVAGRTLDIFHPYAGSKKVTYISCSGFGAAGAGVNIVTTNGHEVGPITFIDCDIDITGTTSAVNIALSSGAPANVDVTFDGGSYKTSGGASAALGSIGRYKIRGAVFDGPNGFNCPDTADATVDFTDAEIVAAGDSPTALINGLIVNSAVVKLVGGSVTATNTDVGGAQAILGTATRLSNETTLTPEPATGVTTKAFKAGEVSLQADGGNSFANISLPINESDSSKIIVSLSLLAPTDSYLPDHSITWNNIDSTQIRARVLGLNSTANKLSYSIRILE